MNYSKSSRFKKIIWILVAFSVLILGSSLGYVIGSQEDFPEEISADNPSSEEAAAPSASDHIIVKFKDGVSNSEENQIKSDTQTTEIKTIDKVDAQILDVPDSENSHKAVLEFRNEFADKIDYAELDAQISPSMVPNDTNFNKQWGLPKINAPSGWDITQGSSSVKIAVLDTGVNVNHPDLINKLAPGWNVVDNNNDVTDLNGHGTLMMGIAGGQTNNNIGIAGLGIEPKIMMVRISNNAYGWAYSSDMAEAIIYAADNGAKVISISFGGTSASTTVRNAVNYAVSKGVFITAAAGNSGSSQVNYPAAYDNVVAVGATDSNDQKASWSNFGPWVDVTSPGVSIYSTNENGGYSYSSGTSPATPFVAGLAALMLSKNPNLTPLQVENYIESFSDDLGSNGRDDIFGYGRINAVKTLSAVTNQSPPVAQVGSIAGKVTNANDHSTITGAKVYVLQNGVTKGTINTISDGSYIAKNLTEGFYEMIVSATGYVSTFEKNIYVQAGKVTENQNFALQSNNKNGFISGKVIDYKGRPVKKALVMMQLVSSPRKDVSTLKKSVYTTKSGRFSFNDLPEGTYYIRTVNYARFASAEIKVYPESTTYVNLKLSKSQYWKQANFWIKKFFKK